MTVNLKTGHRRWQQRAENRDGRNLKVQDVEHLRIKIPVLYRDLAGNLVPFDNVTTWFHIAVVTMNTGECYVGTAQYNYFDQYDEYNPVSYKKSVGYNISVGRALMYAALVSPDFVIDNELSGREYGKTVKGHLEALGFFDEEVKENND